MRKIFLIGGLGADERVFQNIPLLQFEKVFINWIKPIKNELIENYAKRLCAQITEKEPIILGVSFGGILAVEIAKEKPMAKVFIVSSAKSYIEIPLLYRLIGRLGFLKMIPTSILKYHNWIVDWFFGVENPSESTLLKSVLLNTDGSFLKWALLQITTWKNTVVPSNLVHIHGSKDRILPICYIKSKNIVQGGGHLMILNKFKKIEDILHQKLIH